LALSAVVSICPGLHIIGKIIEQEVSLGIDQPKPHCFRDISVDPLLGSGEKADFHDFKLSWYAGIERSGLAAVAMTTSLSSMR
jgi:hypothetical protein